MSANSLHAPHPSSLIIHTDGGARGNPGPAATGVAVFAASRQQLQGFGRYLGETTNNVAEYSAVIDALQWVLAHYSHPYPLLEFKLDSNLVVQQLNRVYRIKEPRLAELAAQVWHLLQTHGLDASFDYVPRAQNHAADAEVNRVLDEQLKID